MACWSSPSGPSQRLTSSTSYAQGDAHTASGALEGDFSALMTDDPAAEPRPASLRLDDGRELTIELLDIELSTADFDVRGDHPGADLLN